MKHALVIKTEMLLTEEKMRYFQEKFAQELKTGVVIIPPYFEAELLNVPTDVEVIIESRPKRDTFLDKDFIFKNGEEETENGS